MTPVWFAGQDAEGTVALVLTDPDGLARNFQIALVDPAASSRWAKVNEAAMVQSTPKRASGLDVKL